jgi:hypothetical protein
MSLGTPRMIPRLLPHGSSALQSPFQYAATAKNCSDLSIILIPRRAPSAKNKFGGCPFPDFQRRAFWLRTARPGSKGVLQSLLPSSALLSNSGPKRGLETRSKLIDTHYRHLTFDSHWSIRTLGWVSPTGRFSFGSPKSVTQPESRLAG